MSQADWKLLDQALGMIRLTLARNVVFNIMKEKTIGYLIKALSNIYEKPSIFNKIYHTHHLFNLKMKKEAFVTNHINESNLLASSRSIRY